MILPKQQFHTHEIKKLYDMRELMTMMAVEAIAMAASDKGTKENILFMAMMLLLYIYTEILNL